VGLVSAVCEIGRKKQVKGLPTLKEKDAIRLLATRIGSAAHATSGGCMNAYVPLDLQTERRGLICCLNWLIPIYELDLKMNLLQLRMLSVSWRNVRLDQ
jgi:hypothetical protein